MISKVIIFVTLFACWIAFSGEFKAFYIVTGLISSAIGVYAAVRMDIISKLDVNKNIFKYMPWLAWQIILSSLDVIKRVWNIRPINPVMAELSTIQNTDMGYTILGNSITMTPGTVTVSVDEANGKILVHAISPDGLKDLETGEMDKRVKAAITDWEK